MIDKRSKFTVGDVFKLCNRTCIVDSTEESWDWDYHGHHDHFTNITWHYDDTPRKSHVDKECDLLRMVHHESGAENLDTALSYCRHIRSQLSYLLNKGAVKETIDKANMALDQLVKSLNEIE